MRSLPKFDILVLVENQICDQSMLKQFASFLVDHAISEKTFDVFKGGTSLQYMSHMVTLISQKWPQNENYKEMQTSNSSHPGPKWITEVRESLKKEIQRRCIDTGEKYSDTSEPIGRNLLLQTCKELLKQNTSSAISQRILFVTNFAADGLYTVIYIIFFLE